MSRAEPLKLETEVCESWEKYHTGNHEVIEEIYPKLMPFCLKVCSRTCGRYIDESDEEASIARMSILEAFHSYDPDKGYFLVYLGRVIRNRLIDFKRSEKRKKSLFLEDLGLRDDMVFHTEDDAIEKMVEELARAQEIEKFKEILSSFDIKFCELAASSPRQSKTREITKKICWVIAMDEVLQAYLLKKRKLPIKMLEEKKRYNRKLLDRYRKYIIAGSLIIIYDLTYLKSFIWAQGGTDHV
jgi:RNA polymerase sigma factor